MSTLRVVADFPETFQIVALAAGENLAKLAEQIPRFQPRFVCVPSHSHAERLAALTDLRSITVVWGEEGLCRIATHEDVQTVVVATSGLVGLRPTVEALQAGKTVGLANKETLVAGGRVVMGLAESNRLLPIDSEHSAIFQCLQGVEREQVRKVILTASGGPFVRRDIRSLANVTPEEALAHPTWSMGKKISIDSATLMNKALELIEARWLFDLAPDQLEAVIHPQSVVHGMVELTDGSHLCHFGPADMRLPIALALSYPKRLPIAQKRLTVTMSGPWEFLPASPDRFPALGLAAEALRRNDGFRVALDASDELAVGAFLAGRIGFLDIVSLCEESCLRFVQTEGDADLHDMDSILETNRAARRIAQAVLDERTR